MFIVVRYVLGRRINFKCFSVRLQDGETCGNSCPDPLDNILWRNLIKMFLHPCWRLCLPVLFNIWGSRTFWQNRCGVWRSWVVRYFGWNYVSVVMMRVSQRRCWNMLQQNSGNICCQCTMISFVTAQCLDRGVAFFIFFFPRTFFPQMSVVKPANPY